MKETSHKANNIEFYYTSIIVSLLFDKFMDYLHLSTELVKELKFLCDNSNFTHFKFSLKIFT